MALVVMVVQVLIAKCDTDDALHHQGLDLVLNQFCRACIGEARGKPLGQPVARSVRPSSRAPASEVIAPPSKLATTRRPSTGGNSNRAGLHSVGIGASYGSEKKRGGNTFLSESEPQCPRFGEKCGLAATVARTRRHEDQPLVTLPRVLACAARIYPRRVLSIFRFRCGHPSSQR
jgi:hypothetical protein